MWQPPERIKHERPEAARPSRDEVSASLMYQPIEIGPRTATTRTWIPAMVPWRASDDGFVTPDVIDWYRRFAEGRPGVLVVDMYTGYNEVTSTGKRQRGGCLAHARRKLFDALAYPHHCG